MGTVSVLSSVFCLNSGVANGDICFLDKRRLELKNVHVFKMEKYISKRKLKAFQISTNYFSCHMHFQMS